MFMTDDQKKYYAAMKKMGNKKPVKATPRPRVRLTIAIVLAHHTCAKRHNLLKFLACTECLNSDLTFFPSKGHAMAQSLDSVIL